MGAHSATDATGPSTGSAQQLVSHVRDLQDHLARSRVDIHSVLLAHGDELLLEWYEGGRTRESTHRMYSVSKSFTALAVGLAADEGLIDLDGTLAQAFPHRGPMHPWVAEATLRDLLQMRGPHASTTYKRHEGGWLESYFRVPPTHRPGTVFRYDTSASYTLAALVELRSGQPLGRYLVDRALGALGVRPDLHFLTSPEGHASGGSGLRCRPIDLLAVAQWLNGGGDQSGARLDPAFVSAATSRQVSTALHPVVGRFQHGYGYQTWIPFPGAYCFFGMGGQMVLSIPGADLVLVTTADTQRAGYGDQLLIDALVTPLMEDVAPGLLPAAPDEYTGSHTHPAPGTWQTNLKAPGGESMTLAVDNAGGRLDLTSLGLTLPFFYAQPVHVDDLGGFGSTRISAGWTDTDLLTVVARIDDAEVSSLEIAVHVGPAAADSAPDQVTIETIGYGESLPTAWNGVRTFARR